MSPVRATSRPAVRTSSSGEAGWTNWVEAASECEHLDETGRARQPEDLVLNRPAEIGVDQEHSSVRERRHESEVRGDRGLSGAGLCTRDESPG